MEGRRKPKGDTCRKLQNRRPPRGRVKWQQTVPSWEKQFCKVIGLFDWETLLQIQKFTHLYENVVNWNDSAGEDAFFNAKKRFWANINGISCDVQLPDPNLYIDEINWDSETVPELQADLESDPVTCNTEKDHDPVVIFGDSLISNQGYSTIGWGDDEDNFEQFPANSFSNNHIDQWEQNWGDSVNNAAKIGRPDFCYYSNNAWDFSGNAGYVTWEGGWNGDWGQNYANNNSSYELGPFIEDKRADKSWNDSWGQNYANNGFDYELGPYREDKGADRGWNDGGQNNANNNFNYEVGPVSEDKRAYGGRGQWNNDNANAPRNNVSSYTNSRYKQMPVMGTINR